MNNAISFLILLSGLSLIGFSFTNCGGMDRLKPTLKSELDKDLDAIIEANDLKPLPTPQAEEPNLIALGKELFFETGMSGLNDVSCASCHEPSLGSGDHLPFAVGSGAIGVFPNRKQFAGASIPMKRHSPAIFNKGHKTTGITHALWDGRLTVNAGVITSPVPEISGENPSRPDITALMENAFDLQPLFPIISADEFLGTNNPLADLEEPTAIWRQALNQLLIRPQYVTLFKNAYNNINTNDIGPGHIARAIRAFVKTKFLANNTPFDRYLAGDIHAMTEEQKLGMRVFYTNAACNVCHSGTEFTNGNFESIATPQLGFAPFQDDLGREQATNQPADRYKFKVPNLRNSKLHPPYMHNGAFDTLERVIDHYSNVEASLTNYVIPPSYQQHYDDTLVVDDDNARNQSRLDQISDPRLRNSLHLNNTDKAHLLQFIRDALTDTTFLSR